jgi:REP element-mobilizing transposase RayT
VSDVVQRIKGTSSKVLGGPPDDMDLKWPGWQQEYGVLTFGERSLDKVVEYVANQKRRHSNGNTWPHFETFDRLDLD